METRTNYTTEQQKEKSFNVLASVDLYRYDLKTYGHILPETRERVYEEELSYIAEGINRPNYNSFTLKQIDGELVYFHEGSWRPYMSTLVKGLNAAEAEAQIDPRKSFEVDRRVDDLKRGYAIQSLKPGEKITWYYDFPSQELDLYEAEFLGDMGYQPERLMGYLCEAERTLEGDVIIRHQSVDNSDPEAYAAAELVGQQGGSIDDSREAYDSILNNKHGKEFYAGRAVSEKEREENAWSMVVAHKDLIEDYFLNQIEHLARQQLSRSDLELTKKRLTYGVWATLKQRLDNNLPAVGEMASGSGGYASVRAEVGSAYTALASRGEVLFGCGGSMSGEVAIMNASAQSVFEGIFGKKMNCPFCGATQYGDPCSPNQLCTDCKAEVRNGKVVSEGNVRQVKKSVLDIFIEGFEAWNREYKAKEEIKKATERARQAEQEALKTLPKP